MKKLLTVAEKKGMLYMTPSCEALEFDIQDSVLLGTSNVTVEPEQDW